MFQPVSVYPPIRYVPGSPAAMMPGVQPAGLPALPDPETVKARLTTKSAVSQGVQNGAIFGLLGALPLYGIEKLAESKHFLHQMTDLAFPPQVKPEFNPRYNNWITFMKRPGVHLASTAGSLLLISTIAGGTLGWWMISRVRDRLVDIDRVRREQAAGTFTPEKLNLMQRMGLARKPVDDPDEAYQDLLDKDLNPAHAFQQGVKDVLILKVVKGLIPLGLILGVIALTRGGSLGAMSRDMGQQMENITKAFFHPVVLAKMAALPIIGGFIAKKFVPWMRAELDIKDTPVGMKLNPPTGTTSAAVNLPTTAGLPVSPVSPVSNVAGTLQVSPLQPIPVYTNLILPGLPQVYIPPIGFPAAMPAMSQQLNRFSVGVPY